MLSLITRRAHRNFSSVFGRSTICKAFITGNINHSCDRQFDKGIPSFKKLEPRNKIDETSSPQEILSYLKESNLGLEAQNGVIRSQIEKINTIQKDVDDFLLFFYLFNNIHLMVLDDVGPYLSLKIEDFSTTPSQELKRYWADKSFGELTEKLNEHKSNQLFREIIEKKKLPFDELLSACEELVKIARIKTEKIDRMLPLE